MWPRATGLNRFLPGPHLKHVMCCSMRTIAFIYKGNVFDLFFFVWEQLFAWWSDYGQ